MQDTIVPIKKQSSGVYKGLLTQKRNADALRIKGLPSRDEMWAGVKAAMVDLHLMSRQSGSTDSTKAAANIAIIGILYLNGFAGRSGE